MGSGESETAFPPTVGPVAAVVVEVGEATMAIGEVRIVSEGTVSSLWTAVWTSVSVST